MAIGEAATHTRVVPRVPSNCISMIKIKIRTVVHKIYHKVLENKFFLLGSWKWRHCALLAGHLVEPEKLSPGDSPLAGTGSFFFLRRRVGVIGGHVPVLVGSAVPGELVEVLPEALGLLLVPLTM